MPGEKKTKQTDGAEEHAQLPWSAVPKTVVATSLFAVQCGGSTWRMYDVKGGLSWTWILSLLPLVVYSIFTLVERKGKDFNRISVTFILFLICAVPPIWILELDRRENFLSALELPCNETEKTETLAGLPIQLSRGNWVKLFEQTLMLLLVPTRWILPKGVITRERLSVVLINYIALASDIVEMFELFEMREVMEDYAIFLTILSFWTISILQFVVVNPDSGKKESGKTEQKRKTEKIEEQAESKGSEKIRVNEKVSIMLQLLVQDIPFLCIRLYVLIIHRVFYSQFFFAAKNILFISVQLYYMVVKECGLSEPDKDGDGRID